MSDRSVALAPPRWLALRWLLVTVTGAGLIAMHTLMGVGDGHCAGATTDAMAGAPSTPGTGLATGVAPTTGAVPTTGVVVTAASVPMIAAATETDPAPMIAEAPTAGHAPMTDAANSAATGRHGHGSMSMLGHLCLAVLGLLLLALAVPALLALLGREVNRAGQRLAGHPASSGQPRAPPPTNVRLAELCISRR